ncbi:MAG: DUF3883 domain-containing protein [Flavobacterium nitrogenifigens]|uniref:DUF3883 domain-containing protein n=1 Tax=Flavobacterium nitrogenifigens TaxID=1617283 RepID=UPI002806CA31|nr:DUF3883 domain-containing protein [Flavobacterium nitrogenifigens]MDQ8013384.1 DUF3883 domain-containing protein [Flavobacterium nitrogenifigens]
MNLQETVEKLFNDSYKTPARGLSAIAEAERYLQQAYQGRYFFELIQNVRDANKEINLDGEIFIDLTDKTLVVSNTGAEFNVRGIEGITTIGKSIKRSQDYIGFKGIGFKSIQEVTDEPRIITRYGSVYFDRKSTLKKYKDNELDEEQIPLFYFPHFNPRTLSDSELQKNIVTKIELPVKGSVTEEKIVEAFSEIQARQLLLLGNIKNLYFTTANNNNTSFSINKNSAKKIIEVTKNDNELAKFKYFTPKNKFEIPQEIINGLEGKEKEIFSNSSSVDINLILELTEHGQIQPIIDAKLYLFYPLQFNSGFRFIIHSYFIVNPERTALRESPLNDFLLSSIGEFMSEEMLRHLKETKANTNKIYCFKRNKDAKINILYDSVVTGLAKQRFVYDNRTQRYFLPSEVIITENFDKGLFPDGKLDDKKLIYTDDKEVIDWLQNEFNIPYLEYEDIADKIENECRKQLKAKNVNFFQNLYNYASQHDRLNLTGKKVLLTDQWKLVSNEEDVFYGGGRKNPINLPKSIKKQIHFIHKEIKISDFREGRSRTGITEFNTYELVRRLLKLFSKSTIEKSDLLNALYNIQPLDNKSEIEIKEKILFPVKGTGKWLSPITNAIYFETENLKELYPNGNFADETLLNWLGEDANQVSPKDFLKNFGVWQIPAVYLSPKQTIVKTNEHRNRLLDEYSSFSSRPFYIQNDRVLDKPAKFNFWFTNTILNNWKTYQSFIDSDLLPKLQYASNLSSWRNVGKEKTTKFCQAIEFLSKEEWICFEGENDKFSVNDVIGIREYDFSQPHNYVIRKFLKLLPIDYATKRDLIEAIGLTHVDALSIESFKRLLHHIYLKHKNNIPEGKEFVDFYNRILSKLVDFFYFNNQSENILQLKNQYFLAVNDISKKAQWKTADKIFYLDDKPNYDILPLSIKERIQPHFTNRDKNTFGKIAGKIGIKFSNSIEKELIQSESSNTSNLVSFFNHLPESIALLESRLDIVLNDYLDKLRSIRVYEKDDLKVKISIGDSQDIIIPVNHFIDADNDFSFYFSNANNPNKNKQFAESISELFINLLGRDLRQYNSDLFRFLNSNDKKQYLKDYDILEERINEIRDKLNSYDLTADQKFWESILAAKGISERDDIFSGKEINIEKLADLLGIEDAPISKIQDGFNFHQKSAPENIHLLKELFTVLSLKLEDLNKNIFPKIDFRSYYEKKLIKLKAKFERGFEEILYNHLSGQAIDAKSNYQDLLDKYKRSSDFLLPLNIVEINYKDYFLESLKNDYPYLEISAIDLDKERISFNPVQIFTENLKIFRSKLNENECKNENLDIFFAENKRRSLMYFNEIESLSKIFKDWFGEFEEKNKPTGDESDLENFLSEFSNQTTADIEEVRTHEIDVPMSSGSSNASGNGRRYDGGANDLYKKRIGLVAEMIVYEKLKTLYQNVNWVSKYASKIYKTHQGYNPEGQDGLGHDIEYTDNEDNKIFVEVKGRWDNSDAFEITNKELEKAYKEQDNYRIFYVTHVLDNSKRKIKDLGNIFLLEEGEDFFSNRKFKAVYRNFEIRFKEMT